MPVLRIVSVRSSYRRGELMMLCKYCGGVRRIKRKYVEDGHGYSHVEYWYQCCKCGSKTESISLCDFEHWGKFKNSILLTRLKLISKEWNYGNIQRNESYFNVTISREEYERLKRGE